MSKNLMPEVAKLLGVEIGEKFKIKELNETAVIYEHFNSEQSTDCLKKFYALLSGEYTVVKLPKLSQSERTILENLPKEYKWIARDENDGLTLFDNRPYKDCINWATKEYSKCDYEWFRFYDNIFQFIKWEDEEPYNIEKLLKED